MKKIIITAIAATFVCALSACSAYQAQKPERQAFQAKETADRQVTHAQTALEAATAAQMAAAANLADKKQKQSDADAALQQLLFPQPQ